MGIDACVIGTCETWIRENTEHANLFRYYTISTGTVDVNPAEVAASLLEVDMHTIRKFEQKDIPGLLEVLKELSLVDAHYPPKSVIEEKREETWLMQYEGLHRAVSVCGNNITGHVQIVPAKDPLTGIKRKRQVGLDLFFEKHQDVSRMYEISRLFVDGRHHGKGIGRALLEHATKHITDRECVPVLCVNETQKRAIELYDKLGWQACGFFTDKAQHVLKVYKYDENA